ncbi:MAG: HD domain-containing protein [Desulfobacterota bacterium]|nr:HD domain-containing protein [Thermodesulfobacteriota bacterium]
MRFWKPEDIFEVQCLRCGRAVEFFKDDVKRKCRCGEEIVNPRLDFGCAQWCEYGEQCLGVMPKELEDLKKELEKGRFKEKFAQAMKRYFGKDLKRIAHAQKVARFAEEMAKKEGANPLVVLGSAYLHEVGIYEAERKHASLTSEGPPIVKDLLKRMNLKEEVIEEICDIIAHLSQPRPVETLNFQILYEANWLVKIEEEGLGHDKGKLETLIEKVFQTDSGKALAIALYLQAP